LYYKKLDDDARKIVWDKNFIRLKKETDVQVELSTQMIAMDDSYIKSVEWNGREIRNGKYPSAKHRIHTDHLS
jgi:hypothetical protein